ncbi:MAG TPA: protein kinase [Gemmatimonadales bacterium]
MTGTPDRLSAALAGRYRIERELGAGGMATVWSAHDLKHDRKVAIKVLHPHLAALVGADRFLKEIRTTANLQHPHILPLFDSGEADGLLFYVMPLVDGESLRQRIARENQLPIADAVRISSEVASALDYAHRQGVIHRDIKPENILLHDGRALVADFGIALAPATGDTRLTETGMSIGTPHYMSPEQALGERQLDARTDIYAVGAVLYETLTGRPPFTGPSAQAIVAKVISQKPVPPSRLRKDVPRQVEDAVLTALQKEPARRFATAADLQAALLGSGSARMTRARRRSIVRGVLAIGGLTAAVLLATHSWSSPGGAARGHVPDTAAVRLVKKAAAFEALRKPWSCDSATKFYSDATYRDSLYAKAFGSLARAHALCGMFGAGDPRTEFIAASNAAAEALRLDPGLAVGHTAKGMVALFGHQDFSSARRDFREAIRLDTMAYEPWLYQTWCYVGSGMLDSAVASIRHAYRIEPTAPIVGARLSQVLLLHGDTSEAERSVNEVLSEDPTNDIAHAQRLELYDATGRCDAALREVKQVERSPLNFNQALVAYALATCGQRDRAGRLVDSLAQPGAHSGGFQLAIAFAGLGDSTRAFAALDSAIANHNFLLFFLPHYFAFVRYHGTRAFQDVLARAHVKG